MLDHNSFIILLLLYFTIIRARTQPVGQTQRKPWQSMGMQNIKKIDLLFFRAFFPPLGLIIPTNFL
jgi:hypothetical protein